jgi:hypothetical protein
VVGISISEYKRNESMRKPLESLWAQKAF